MTLNTDLVYPAAITAWGDIAVTADYATQVHGAIMSCLNTVKGERVYRETYGLQPTLFKSDRLLSQIRAVRDSLTTIKEEFPDVPFNVTGYIVDGMSIAQVAYSVNGKNQIEQLRIDL